MSDKYILLLTVIEGRSFPQRQNFKVLVEAKLDGQEVRTDTVNHITNPEFIEELGWEVSKKDLQAHRLQRTPLVVRCYSLDENMHKEELGYAHLDLRQCPLPPDSPQAPKWHPLIQSKYPKHRPELLLHLTILADPDHLKPRSTVKETNNASHNSTQEESSFHLGLSATGPEGDGIALKPVLSQDKTHFLIGPSHKCKDLFVLSVTLALAENLAQLLPQDETMLPSHRAFHFYYNLLGNDVITDRFYDLQCKATFPAEKAVVKIRSAIDLLRKFFTKNSCLQIFLCCGEVSLGSARIQLKDLMDEVSDLWSPDKPVLKEGLYEVKGSSNRSSSSSASDYKPVVGVSIQLLRENKSTSPKPTQNVGLSATQIARQLGGTSLNLGDGTIVLNSSSSSAASSRSASVIVEEVVPSSAIKNTTGRTMNVPFTPPEKLENFDGRQPKRPRRIFKTSDHRPIANGTSEGDCAPELPCARAMSTGKSGQPEKPHCYIFSLDMRTIRLPRGSKIQYSTFIKYTYEYFGLTVPIETHPLMTLFPEKDVKIPNGFVSMKFATRPAELVHSVETMPLVAQLVQKDAAGREVTLGRAILDLKRVLQVSPIDTVTDDGIPTVRRSCAMVATFLSDGDSRAPLATMQLRASVDDCGLMPDDFTFSTSQLDTTGAHYARTNITPDVAQLIGDDVAFKTVLELEQWKERQEKMFLAQLKEKETRQLALMTEEWETLEAERETMIQRRVQDCQEHEKRLRLALAEAEKREKNAATKEQDFNQKIQNLHRDHDLNLQETREASRRLKLDCEHQIDIERRKTRDAEERISRLRADLAAAEQKVDAKQREFDQLRKEQFNRPDIRLKADMHVLLAEKVELQRKVESLQKSKVHYKQQFLKSLKELGSLKQALQDDAINRLKGEKRELEQMRLRDVATREKAALEDDRKVLREIKGECNRLESLQNVDHFPATYSTSVGLTTATGLPYAANSATGLSEKSKRTFRSNQDQEKLTRLQERRDNYLKMGLYNANNPIIQKLSQEIQDIICNES